MAEKTVACTCLSVCVCVVFKPSQTGLILKIFLPLLPKCYYIFDYSFQVTEKEETENISVRSLHYPLESLFPSY